MRLEITGTWKGYFEFGEGYDEGIAGKKGYFIATLTEKNGVIEGTSQDTEGEGVVGEPATVKGFIEGDMISFVKTYPCKYFYDEDGNLIKDAEAGPHEVTYVGYFNSGTLSFTGNWEIDTGLNVNVRAENIDDVLAYENDQNYIPHPSDYYTLYDTGTWELWRVK
ncbi:MAG TPA: hypothetical protein VEC12_09345 [Bacteroidia bacterium]|nr:hypothetical protein [Bacteroidia bacterium]